MNDVFVVALSPSANVSLVYYMRNIVLDGMLVACIRPFWRGCFHKEMASA